MVLSGPFSSLVGFVSRALRLGGGPCCLTVDIHTDTIVRATASAEKALGYKKGDLVGLSITALMPEPYRRAHDAARAKKRTVWLERSMVQDDTFESKAKIDPAIDARSDGKGGDSTGGVDGRAVEVMRRVEREERGAEGWLGAEAARHSPGRATERVVSAVCKDGSEILIEISVAESEDLLVTTFRDVTGSFVELVVDDRGLVTKVNASEEAAAALFGAARPLVGHRLQDYVAEPAASVAVEEMFAPGTTMCVSCRNWDSDTLVEAVMTVMAELGSTVVHLDATGSMEAAIVWDPATGLIDEGGMTVPAMMLFGLDPVSGPGGAPAPPRPRRAIDAILPGIRERVAAGDAADGVFHRVTACHGDGSLFEVHLLSRSFVANAVGAARVVSVVASAPSAAERAAKEQGGATLAHRDYKGVEVGGYVLKSVIGTGGFSRVWLAEAAAGEDGLRRRHQKCAVKVISKTNLLAGEVDSVDREFRLLRELPGGHPGIVELVDPPVAVETDTDLFLFTELLGPSLSEMIAAVHPGLLNAKAARKIIAEIAEALVFLHDHGVAHRDVKPGNIMVCQETGQAKLIDFGSAARADAPLDDFVGTTFFASPEVLRNKAGYSGRSADVWSFGMLTAVLVSGIIDKSLAEAALQGRLKDAIKPFATDRAMRKLAVKCCQLDPELRPSMTEVREWALQEVE